MLVVPGQLSPKPAWSLKKKLQSPADADSSGRISTGSKGSAVVQEPEFSGAVGQSPWTEYGCVVAVHSGKGVAIGQEGDGIERWCLFFCLRVLPLGFVQEIIIRSRWRGTEVEPPPHAS
jgi:hypothetical protein